MDENKITGGSQYLKYGKTHYQRNKEAYMARNKARRREIAAFLRLIKEESGCVDCDNKDFRVLDFDHIGEKTVTPTEMSNRLWSYERINKELSQCEVRCANCHRIKTWERLQASMVLVAST